MKRIVVDEEYCKGCHLCIHQCKQKALVVSCKRNAKGYLMPEAPDPELCNTCLQCEKTCPDMAICVEETDDAK